MPKTPAKPDIEIHTNPNMSTLFFDALNIGVRTDGLVLLRFLMSLPEGFFEQGRFVTSRKHILSIIDVLCRQMNHYPKKTGK